MLDPLKLELQVFVSHLLDIGAGNGTQVPEKRDCVSSC